MNISLAKYDREGSTLTEAQRQRDLTSAKQETRDARHKLKFAQNNLSAAKETLAALDPSTTIDSAMREARRNVKFAVKDVSRALSALESSKAREETVRKNFQKAM